MSGKSKKQDLAEGEVKLRCSPSGSLSHQEFWKCQGPLELSLVELRALVLDRPLLIRHWMWAVLGLGRGRWPWVHVSLQAKAILIGRWQFRTVGQHHSQQLDWDFYFWWGIWMMHHCVLDSLKGVLVSRNTVLLSYYGMFSTNPMPSTYTIYG